MIALDGRTLTPAGVVAIARGRAEARIAPAARERNAAAERLVRELLDARRAALRRDAPASASLRSAPSALEDPGDHQWRLLRSHAGGGGAPLTVEVVRAAMAVRANQIGAGGAGVGERLLDALLGALRAGVTPFARELGSLGTGDLTVLAEIGARARRRGRVLGRRRRRAGGRGARGARARAGHATARATGIGVHELQRGQHRPGRAGVPRRDAAAGLRARRRRALLRGHRRRPRRCSTRACTRRARTAGRSRSRAGCASCSATREPRERRAGARPRRVRVPLRAAGRGDAARRARAARGRARDRAQRRRRERADAAAATASRCPTATSTPAC